MIQNNLKISLRKLAKQPAYTALNILGLGLSVGCSILIFTLIRHHLSFDTYHTKADLILRIVMDVKTESVMPFAGVPTPMAKTLRDECSFVEKSAMRSAADEVLISVDNHAGGKDKYKEEGKFAWVELAYFDILDLQLLCAISTIGLWRNPSLQSQSVLGLMIILPVRYSLIQAIPHLYWRKFSAFGKNTSRTITMKPSSWTNGWASN